LNIQQMKTTIHIRIATFAWMLLALLGFTAPSSAETVGLYFDPATPQIAFAAGDIKGTGVMTARAAPGH